MTQRMQVPAEPVYQVVWPLGKFVSPPIKPAAALADLNGKTIGLIWDGVFRGDEMYSILTQELKRKFPSVNIIDQKTMGSSHGVGAKEYIAGLSDTLRRMGCDAVISAVGA